MHRLSRQLVPLLVCVAALPLAGCGTTRSSDTNRTATEQLLVSDAVDRAVQSLQVQTLSGQTVYLDETKLNTIVDKDYLISSLKQHLLANGCLVRDRKDEAEFVVEARAGAVGTDRNDLLFGIPSMSVPQLLPTQPIPAAIPEIPFAKRRQQRGVVKIALFAYHRPTGTPVWQSGFAHQESTANDMWVLGAGPFQRGTIYDGTAFAGKALANEDGKGTPAARRLPPVDLAQETMFNSPQRLAQRPGATNLNTPGVINATHSEPQRVNPPPNATSINPSSASPAPTPSPAPPAVAPPPPPPSGSTVSEAKGTQSGDTPPLIAAPPAPTTPAPQQPLFTWPWKLK